MLRRSDGWGHMGFVAQREVTDDAILDFAREIAVEGYETDEELVRTVAGGLAGGLLAPELLDRVGRLAAPLLDELQAPEAGWPIPTDNDRLDRAFRALDQDGILTRQNWYGDDQAVADEEMRHQLQAARLAGRSLRGFAFFTGGELRRALAGEGLRITWGTALPRNAARARLERSAWEIAQDIHRALWGQRLSPDWSRVIGDPITLPFTWRRRRRRWAAPRPRPDGS